MDAAEMELKWRSGVKLWRPLKKWRWSGEEV